MTGDSNVIIVQGTSYQPTWFERSSTCNIGEEKCNKSVAQQILQKEVFVKTTENQTGREGGASAL